MFFDTHLHTSMSLDSEMQIEEALESAKIKNLGLILTEHYDYSMDSEQYPCVDCDAYFKNYSKYRGDNLLLGIEIGLTKAGAKTNAVIANTYDFDYILGSVHEINEIDIYVDCKINNPETISFEQYLNTNIEMVKTNDFFHSLGHIDYISRYSSRPVKAIIYETYASLYDQLFNLLVEKNILLEMNTNRFGDKKNHQNLHTIYTRYHTLGGRYVTLGSDAHTKENIGHYFGDAIKMAHHIGLKPVYFKKRQMIECVCSNQL